jgi:itaconyl-CoA hydratase
LYNCHNCAHAGSLQAAPICLNWHPEGSWSRRTETAPGRWRAAAGRYFEDFTVCDIYEHRPGRAIGEADNTWFTLLTMNQHPLHFDEIFAARSEFGRPVVNSCLTLSIVAGISVADVSRKAITNLGWTDIGLVAPVFIRDIIYAKIEVLSKRRHGVAE